MTRNIHLLSASAAILVALEQAKAAKALAVSTIDKCNLQCLVDRLQEAHAIAVEEQMEAAR